MASEKVIIVPYAPIEFECNYLETLFVAGSYDLPDLYFTWLDLTNTPFYTIYQIYASSELLLKSTQIMRLGANIR